MQVSPADYVGDSSDRTGFAGLEAVDEVTMLCVPDLTAALERGMLDMEGFKAVQLAMIAHCELMADRVAILDPPPSMNAQQVKEWRVDDAGYDWKYATLYWPRLKVMDPTRGKAIFIPPSGHMAGIWARNDDTRGVHKAPANEVVRGAISLELNITKGEHDQLNPIAVNCIRSFPGQGIRIWGARTLSSDPEWRYLNVRRLFNFVEESILRHQLGRVRAERPEAVGFGEAHGDDVPAPRVARRRAVRSHAGRGVLRQVRRREQPAGEPRRRHPDRRDRHRPGEAAEFVVFRICQFSGGAGLEE